MSAALRKFPILLAALASMTACTHWSGDLERIVDETGRDFKVDPDRDYKKVDLRELVASPTAYKLMDVRFYAVINRVPAHIFISFYSVFRQEDYISFSAWAGDAPLWEADERLRSVPTLFMRKESPYVGRLVEASRFALVEILGRVMGDYNQMPWIEVLKIEEVVPSLFTEQSLEDYRDGMAAMAENRPVVAISKFEAAVKAPLSPRVRVWVRLNLGKLYEARGEFDKAAYHYDAILLDDENNSTAWDGWERCQKALDAKRAAEGGQPQTPPKRKK